MHTAATATADPAVRRSIRQRWSELRPLFEQAMALPATQRSGFVDALDADLELRAALRLMLADAGDEAIEDEAATPTAGLPRRIGRYAVLREIGRGGMGVVYLAEQLAPRRRVAIKRLAVTHEPSLRARFVREGELLARLAHPAIAQVIEADVDAEGHPYLVMEYIDGVDLALHAASLSRAARIALLAQIADAVEHAHSRGVVHRDLKPSNILVNKSGEPKVLDFGIGQELGISSTLTQTGMLMGTPAYMSPEQAAGVAAADARSDVYALGVIGYELLANRLPLPVSGLTPLEALRVIGQDTPPPLARLDPSLRGDLDTVISTALAREPSLRYASAGALADELRRVLAHEPIRARRPGLLRRLGLYARRQPKMVAAVAMAASSLIVGAALALHFGLSAAHERDRAEAALADARGTQAALAKVFAAGNPVLAGKPEVLFREVLRAAPAQIEDLAPAIRLPVQYTVALAQAQIGDEQAAIDSFAAAARIASELGNAPARAQAELRRITVAYEQEDIRVAARAMEALLLDPALQADPVLHAAALVLGAEVAAQETRVQTVVNRLLQARQIWPRGATALPIDDPKLLAEFEIRALIVELTAATYGLPSARDLSDLLSAVSETHRRLAPQFREDDPFYAALDVLHQYLPTVLAKQGGWQDALIARIDAETPRLGPGHPTILAQLHAGMMLGRFNQLADKGLRQRLAAAAQAVNGNVRRRLRLTLLALTGGLTPAELGIEGQALLDLRKVVCGEGASADLDCLQADLTIAQFDLSEGRTQPALQRLGELTQQAKTLPPSSARLVLHDAAFLYTNAGQRTEAVATTDLAIEALKANSELPQAVRDQLLMFMSWSFRPERCDRVLALIEPIEARLAALPSVPGDVMARLLATCEVRAEGDLASALARLEPWRLQAQQPGIDPLLRQEIVIAYLEIYDVLGREPEFLHWARELKALEASGVKPHEFSAKRMPWVQRAREVVAATQERQAR